MKDILIRVAMIIAACAFACALVMLLVAVLVHVDQHIFRERAERLRNDIIGITPRQTTLDSEDAMLSSWTDSVTRSTPCDKNFCDIHIVVERPFTDALQAALVAVVPRGLRLFKFLGGRPASANGTIYVRNGYVWGASFALTSYVFSKPGDAQWPDGYFIVGTVRTLPWSHHWGVDEYSYPASGAEYGIEQTNETCTQCVSLTVDFSPYAARAQVERLSRYNYECLTAESVCTKAEDLLPVAAHEIETAVRPDPLSTPVCDPKDLPLMSRDADSVGVFIVKKVTLAKALPSKKPGKRATKSTWETLDIQLEARIKRAEFWDVGTTRKLGLNRELVDLAPDTPSINVGDRVIVMFDRPEGDAADAPVRANVCGVALSTPKNLTAARAGAALDKRVAPLAAYEDGYAPAK
jgi:hypothetical protein